MRIDPCAACGYRIKTVDDAARCINRNGPVCPVSGWCTPAEVLDARAAELSKEQHDQPDAQFPN